jgi:transcriptional regulator with XRE-family HTH domain
MGASIGENIRRIRIRKGLSQKELAEKAGMSNVLLNNYEHGLRNPKAETLQRIAQALGVSPEVLQGEEMSEMQAKKRLYAIFSQFGGQAAEIGGKTLVCFEKLDLGALCRNYQIYRQRSAEAEAEQDARKREEMKKAAWNGFEEWMELGEE